MAAKKTAKPPVKQDGKTKIIEGAIACFTKKGVAQTTLKEIAEAAGVDQPLIHYYFKSLDELYSEVIKTARENLGKESVDVLVGETHPQIQLRKYIEGTLAWGQRHAGLYSIWIYFYYLASYQPSFSELNASIREMGRDRLELIIHRGIQQGCFHAHRGMDAHQLAICVHTFLTGALVIGGTGRKKGSQQNWNETIELTLKGALQWLGADPH
jgi:AcrR family transcriptional regulator